MADELRITMKHAQAARLCSRGVVRKMKLMGYPPEKIKDLLQNGMPISEARLIGDAQIDKIIEKALEMERENGEG